MKTVLVTGGAGFIGSHIVDKLIQKKYNVVVFDNLITGKIEFINKKAIFEKGDVSNRKQFENVFKKYKFDAIFHIAGQPSIVNAFSDPVLDVNTNFIGTINATMLSLKYGISRFLYASSMTLYGNPETLPIKENAKPAPINYYGIAKYASERFVHITSERLDLETEFFPTSFRMFNVYGPRQSLTNPYQGVLAIFIGNVLRHEPITIFGNGKQGRDFVYVEDVANAWVNNIENKKSYGNVYNIGAGKQTPILTLAKIVIKACGFDPKKYPIVFKPKRSGDQKFIEADINRARKDLKFKPNYSLSKGLKATLEWAKNN